MPDNPTVRFELSGGMNTMSPTDAMEPGSYPYLQNVRRNQQGRISSRPPLSDNLLGSAVAGTGGITSLIRLNDTTNLTALPAGYVYIMDAAGTLYITTTSIATGLSGNPLGFVTFRPNAAPNPWCYVTDPSIAVTIPAYISSGYGLVTGMVKVRSDGTCWKTGIKEPQTAPTVVFAGGGGGTAQIQYRYVYRSSATGGPSNPSPESVAGTNEQFGPSETQVCASGGTINPNITVNGTQYEGNGTQIRTKGGVAPGTITDYVIAVNFAGLDIPDGTQVATVTGSGGSGMTPGTYALSFSGGSPTTPATGTITVLTATTYTIAVTSGGVGYLSAPSVTAATGGTPPSLIAILTTAANIDGVLIDLNWLGQNAGTGVLSGVQLVYQGSPLGIAKQPGIANQSYSTDALQGGASDTWGATITASIANDPTFGFGVQITTQSVGGSDRSFLDTMGITVYYSTQNADVTPVPSLDPQVDKIDFYRMGGALPSFTYVGTGPNSSTVFVDTLNDLAALGNPLLQFDNYEPFPSIGLPLGGTGDVAAGSVSGTMQLTVTSGDNLPLNMLPGTDMIIGTTAYTTYNRPTTATAVTLVLPAGQSIPNPGTGLVWEIQEPDLAATPSPVMWGPTPDNAGAFAFGLDPINTGDLLWTLGNNFDSADQGNRLAVTTPSEPLMNGTITSELATVFSTDRFWLIYPNFADVSILTTGVQGSPWTLVQSAATRGLFMRYAIDALGAMIAWRAKDCIAVSMGGGPEKSITDSIYNLFPHGGQQPSAITLGGYTVYPPDDTKPLAQTIKIAPGYIFYNYQDTTGTPRTLVYDVEAKGWSVDAYTPTVNCHLWAVGPVAQLLTGCSDGTVRQLITGGTETGTSVASTPALNTGEARAQKRLGDSFFKATVTTSNPVALALYGNRYATALSGYSPTSLTGTGTLAGYIVDFTSGIGFDLLDVAAQMSWPLGSGNVLEWWEPSWTQALPDSINDRPTAWMDLGGTGSNYVRGLILEADTFNAAKAFSVEDELGNFHVPQESPITLNGQQKIGLSFNPPFVSHIGRIFSNDGVPWRRAPDAGWMLQWIGDPYPELTRAWTPIMEMSGPDNKFFQGVKLIADTANQPVTFQILYDGGQTGPTFTGTFNGKQTLVFSWTPFEAHDIQLVPQSSARIWYGGVGQGQSEWVFEPIPEKALNWITELTAMGGQGWQSLFYLNIEYAATATITLAFTVDAGNGSIAPATITLPSTSGAQTKMKFTLTPNKWKLLGLSAASSAPFSAFAEGMEIRAHNWEGKYRLVRPSIGGPSSGAATI